MAHLFSKFYITLLIIVLKLNSLECLPVLHNNWFKILSKTVAEIPTVVKSPPP